MVGEMKGKTKFKDVFPGLREDGRRYYPDSAVRYVGLFNTEPCIMLLGNGGDSFLLSKDQSLSVLMYTQPQPRLSPQTLRWVASNLASKNA